MDRDARFAPPEPEEGLRLLDAFTSISDKHLRDGIVAMVKAAAQQSRGVSLEPEIQLGEADMHS